MSYSKDVVIKDAVLDDVVAASADVAARHGATVTRTYDRVLRGYAATMSEQDARRTAADPAVACVEQDQLARASADRPDPPSWGQDRVDQRDLSLDRNYAYGTIADNVDAYLIDTGINLSHNDFGARAVSGHDFVDNDADATDRNGHGTHVAGTVGGTRYGPAKGVSPHAVRCSTVPVPGATRVSSTVSTG